MNEWLRLIPLALGIEKYEFLHQYDTNVDRKAARNDSQLLEKAKSAGATLVSSE